MLAKVLTGAVAGVDGALVEVNIAQSGLPTFDRRAARCRRAGGA